MNYTLSTRYQPFFVNNSCGDLTVPIYDAEWHRTTLCCGNGATWVSTVPVLLIGVRRCSMEEHTSWVTWEELILFHGRVGVVTEKKRSGTDSHPLCLSWFCSRAAASGLWTCSRKVSLPLWWACCQDAGVRQRGWSVCLPQAGQCHRFDQSGRPRWGNVKEYPRWRPCCVTEENDGRYLSVASVTIV